MFFGPAGIHALEHLGPVLRFGAASAGVDFDVAVEPVGLAGEEAFDFAPLGFLGEAFQRVDTIGDHRQIGLGLGHFDEFERVGDVGFELQDALDQADQSVALAHEFLRGGRLVPEIGVFGAVVQFFEAGEGDIPVKDASSAARRTA